MRCVAYNHNYKKCCDLSVLYDVHLSTGIHWPTQIWKIFSIVTFHYTICYNANGLVVNLLKISESIHSVYHCSCELLNAAHVIPVQEVQTTHWDFCAMLTCKIRFYLWARISSACQSFCITLTIKRGRKISVHFMASLESIMQIWYTYHSYPSPYSEMIQVKISVFAAKLFGNKKINLILYEK